MDKSIYDFLIGGLFVSVTEQDNFPEGISISITGQMIDWGLRVGFCQGPIYIVGWTPGVKKKVCLSNYWEQTSLYIIASPERL